MKSTIKIIAVLLLFNFSNFAQEKIFDFVETISIKVTNPTDIIRTDEFVSISIDELKKANPKFNKDAFIVHVGDKEIPSQLYNDGCNCSLVFVCNFGAKQTKEFSIKYLENGTLRRDYKSRTYAELAMKFDAVYKNKKFYGDRFENFTKVVVPKIHTDHDALFKYEGPGWESEKVAYRLYLDWRNTTDIFGKKTKELVLNEVGKCDVTPEDEEYHKMHDWGMDIFKVGKSLGLGSIGMTNGNNIEKVSKREEVVCEISLNGPLLSEIKTNYAGWMVGDKKFNLESKLSIQAGSRRTNVNLNINSDAENITTGFAKHVDTEFIKSNDKGDWQYIALYGKQSLANDNLGIVLFYETSSLLKQGEDELNYLVILKPNNNKVKYSFAAAWEQEPDGIKNIDEFIKYIKDEQFKLNNKLIIEFE